MRHAPRATRAPALLVVALVAGACSDAAGPAATDDAVFFDVAVAAADATLEDFTLWSQPLSFGPAPVPGRPGGHDGWSGTFSGTRSVTFYDADGNEQTAYDALTTESIHILHEIVGEIARDQWSADILRERDMTVSGLEGTEVERTWNGTGSEDIVRTRVLDASGATSYHATGTFSYDDVVVPVPGSPSPYPLSGTITRSVTIVVTRPAGEVTRSVQIVITFDGTAIATAVVNGEPMEIDLSTRPGRLPLRRLQG